MRAERLPAMCGSATLAMLVSSTSMKVASITVTAISLGLMDAKPRAGARLRWSRCVGHLVQFPRTSTDFLGGTARVQIQLLIHNRPDHHFVADLRIEHEVIEIARRPFLAEYFRINWRVLVDTRDLVGGIDLAFTQALNRRIFSSNGA